MFSLKLPLSRQKLDVNDSPSRSRPNVRVTQWPRLRTPPAAGQRWQLFRMLRKSAAADRSLSGELLLTRAQNCARVSAASTTGEKLRIRSSADHDQAGGGVLVEHHQCRSHITGFPLPVELSEPDGALRFAPRQTCRHL